MYDVATLAGVSHQTVSRLVKGHTNIRPEIRSRVEAAIAELNYRPNRAARSLATATSRRIAALFFDRLDEVGPTRIVQGASDRAREAGYVLDIVGLDPRQHSDIERAVALIDESDTAGIMVFAPTEAVRDEIARVSFGVPVFLEAGVLPASGLRNGDVTGTALLTDHLLELGHRRFFTITGPLEWFAAQTRLRSLQESVARGGGKLVGQLEGDWSPASGYEAGLRLPLDQGVTALVVSNDQMALGALSALRERGVRVPNDMSVVGFDGIPESRFFEPPLTTVGVEFDDQGRSSMNALLHMIDPGLHPEAAELKLPALFARESTAPALR
nr:LacI family DNA-binding transcriptional regulator [Galbitalea soli]